MDVCTSERSHLMSAEELFAFRYPKSRSLPLRGGQKCFAPTVTLSAENQLQAQYEERTAVLTEERVERLNSLLLGEWLPERNIVLLTKLVGKQWHHMGFVEKRQRYLYSEEAILLMDLGQLELHYQGVAVGIQEAYVMLLQEPLAIEKYQVYAHLSRLGYKVVRPKPKDLMSGENQLQLESKMAKKNVSVKETSEGDKVTRSSDIKNANPDASSSSAVCTSSQIHTKPCLLLQMPELEFPNIFGKKILKLTTPLKHLLPEGVQISRSSYCIEPKKNEVRSYAVDSSPCVSSFMRDWKRSKSQQKSRRRYDVTGQRNAHLSRVRSQFNVSHHVQSHSQHSVHFSKDWNGPHEMWNGLQWDHFRFPNPTNHHLGRNQLSNSMDNVFSYNAYEMGNSQFSVSHHVQLNGRHSVHFSNEWNRPHEMWNNSFQRDQFGFPNPTNHHLDRNQLSNSMDNALMNEYNRFGHGESSVDRLYSANSHNARKRHRELEGTSPSYRYQQHALHQSSLGRGAKKHGLVDRNIPSFTKIISSACNWKDFKKDMVAANMCLNKEKTSVSSLWGGSIRPLVKNQDNSSLDAVYEQLSITEGVHLTQMPSINTSHIVDFDVFIPTPEMKHVFSSAPSQHIIVTRSLDPLPDLSTITSAMRDKIPLLWAVVDDGDIAFYSFNDICLPFDG